MNEQNNRPTSIRVRKPSGVTCYHCGSDRTVKGGSHHTGKRMFICRGCSRTFVDPATRAVKHVTPSAGHLILKLRAVAQEMGRTPTAEQIRRMGQEGRSPRLEDYLRRFGTWQQALRRARLGTYFNREFNDVDRKLLLDALRKLSRRLGRPLVGDDVRAARKKGLVPPTCQYDRAFGGIPKAIAAAGVAPKICYTNDEMIATMRELAAHLDRPVDKHDLNRNNKLGKGPAANTVIRRFGGLRAARAAAGVMEYYRSGNGRTKNWHKYTNAEMLDHLRELAKRLGRKPTYDDVKAASARGECPTTTTYFSRFGSLITAFNAAGFKTRPTSYTDKELISALRRLKQKLGRFPTVADIKRAYDAGECSSQECIRVRLGNLNDLKEWI